MTIAYPRKPRIAIVGPSQCGKDTCAEWFADKTILSYGGSCSMVIAPHAAKAMGLSLAEAIACRHEHRDLWRSIGDKLRADDPAHLARKVLEYGDMVVGVRSRREMSAVISEKLVDATYWVDRPGLPEDPTLEFGPEMADAIIPNHGSLADLYRRLRSLANAMGL